MLFLGHLSLLIDKEKLNQFCLKNLPFDRIIKHEAHGHMGHIAYLTNTPNEDTHLYKLLNITLIHWFRVD